MIYANTINVTRCDDQNHIGDLRHGVAGAINDGDIVDMSALACPNSRISLQLGELATSRNITLLGPGKDQLTITGKYYSSPTTYTTQPYRIIEHTGTGTLTVKNISLANGHEYGSGGVVVAGGCVYSKGSVTLDHAGVYLCRVSATAADLAAGGGIFADYGVTLRYSSVSGNTAYAGGSEGGGVATNGDFYALRSTISGNSAVGPVPLGMLGGGVYVPGNVTIFSSTISGNTATHAGGIYMRSTASTLYTTALIGNSTISGNTGYVVGGILAQKAVTTINSSTIAFNTAQVGGGGSDSFAPGLATAPPSSTVSATVNLHSTLIANNTYGPAAIENDLSAFTPWASSTVTINGANNLIRAATVSLPVGTITGACPLLGPLRDNGGPTRTRALLSHSPGIDQGSNGNLLRYDQRGPPYARQSGAAADIGAYEVQ
ncbi:MAG TPA: choice-of-anchor Q domain-containing protein, partial [Rudaea sp.]|nr:choice-of-anchor Q domain-containing protein [Rudaea sp.]